MWLPLRKAVQPNRILRRLFEYETRSRFSFFQIWIWFLRPSGCLFLALEEHLPQMPALGCPSALLPALVPLAKPMLDWWLRCWYLLGKEAGMLFSVHRAVLVMGKKKSTLPCHCVAKMWARALPQALWPGSGVLPELELRKGFLQNRTWKSTIRFPKKGICRTALPVSLSFTPLIAPARLFDRKSFIPFLFKKKLKKINK